MSDLREIFKVATKKEFSRGTLISILKEYKTLKCSGTNTSCDDATETLNSSPISSIPSGGNKAIILKDSYGNDIVFTVVTDSPTELNLKITDVISSGNMPMLTGQEGIHRDHDDGYNFQNGLYNNTVLTNFYTLVNPNEWGHYKRRTGDTGGYIDEVTGVFYDKDHNVTTYALAFPNDNLRDYATRRKWNTRRYGTFPWNTNVDYIHGATKGGETGWRLPNEIEYLSLCDNGAITATSIDYRLFNWSGVQMCSGTTLKNDASQFKALVPSTGLIVAQLKTVNSAGAYVKNF